MNIGAVVLAAGASFRMGSPKALLEIDGVTFLQRVCGSLQAAGIRDMAIVLGAEADRIQDRLGWFTGVVALNTGWQNGQISSIISGLDALEACRLDGVLLHPVDRPLVKPATVTALLNAAIASGKRIVVPLCDGRRGHPAFFSSSLFNELRQVPNEIGARHLLRLHPADLAELHVDDQGTILNIDTPEQYTFIAGRR
jgi:CTP:molybdopterin cytidylyltransferase MocA